MNLRIAIVFIFLPAIFLAIPAFAASTSLGDINPSLPLISNPSGNSILDTVGAIYQFALMIGGLLAFVAIVYNGVKYAMSGGNSSLQSDAREGIEQALLGLLLLAGAYIVLNTINPALTKPTLPGLQALPPPPPAATSTSPNCGDLSALANLNGVAYPAKNAPDLDQLMSCIQGNVSVSGRSIATYDQSHDSCNYTRGNPVCDTSGTCSHTRNSCHYGGSTGTQGALAVDYGISSAPDKTAVGNAIIQAAIRCGSNSTKARCENSSGVRVDCSAATHVHISAPACDRN
jgi:hypothetical protein